MKRYLKFLFFVQFLFLISTISIYSQPTTRQDAIWARSTTETITLDGKLNEASWAKADSIQITYGKSSGLPTSGWNTDGFTNPSGYFDSTRATLKFLSQNNQLYIAFIVPDSSIGGDLWPGPAWWDGVLMNVKDIRTIPVGREEIFPSWLGTDTTSPTGVGVGPRFSYFGPFRDQRSASDIAKWDMGYSVQGTSNQDTTSGGGIVADTGYIFEMRINLDSLGYNTTQTDGDIVGTNIQIYDCDWYFLNIPAKRSVGRAWWQHPWSDQNENAGRIYIRPDVTIDSGPAPEIEPDAVLPNGVSKSDPNIDGDLSDSVWAGAYTFQINFGDTANIRSYSGIGKNLSAWFEAASNPMPGCS